MNIDEIRARVNEIDTVKSDDEQAHILEDNLYRDFVKYISVNCDNKKLKDMADEILKSNNIEFERWCA